jgi:hypothetical protein
MQNKTHCFASKPMEFRFRFFIYILVPAANFNMRHEKQHYYVEGILIRTLGRGGGGVFDE